MPRRRQSPTTNGLALESLTREQLLDLRFCDLDLRIQGTWLESCIDRLRRELKARELKVRPHFWLSVEWFSPDGVPGVAVPFYLAHPRLMRLERRMMLEVEGGTREECMKLLRHETGHAMQHAFRIHYKRSFQGLFGRSSEPYPDLYRPNPASKRYVQHLDSWYAQSHPDEDFAETFAVWLRPRSGWRQRYRDWPALRKLQWVDDLMQELRGQQPKVQCRERTDSIRGIKRTLREHYAEKRARYSASFSETYDRDLKRIFSTDAGLRSRETAGAFLRRYRRRIRKLVCQNTGEYPFTVDQVLKEMIGRCQELKLRVDQPEQQLILDFTVLLTVHTMHCLYRGPGWHPL